MLLGGIALGLIAGLLAGGRLENIIETRLRWMALIFLAVVLRFGTEAALQNGLPLAELLRVPLLVGASLILLAGLWANRRLPGIAIAFIGVLSNVAVIAANGGFMPIWGPSLAFAGLSAADVSTAIHVIVNPPIDASFLVHLGPLSDVVPIPLPLVRNVASVGDMFITLGLGFFLFATVLRTPDQATAEAAEGAAAEPLGGLASTARLEGGLIAGAGAAGSVRSETGLIAGLAEASILERPILLGGTAPGLASGSGSAEDSWAGVTVVPRPAPAPGVITRARRSPYVRLALNPAFSALWTSGVVSLFGDRVHQVALALLVYTQTQSPVAVGFVFLAATLPNLILGPISGTLVDRWDQKQVLVVSDLLRAAIVLLIPIAAVTNILLVYPLVFLVTSISIFFRPARESVMPRIVPEDELLTANSANWLAETLADIVGYPFAGLFVAVLGSSLPLAFWLDSASYLASGLLILTIAIPPVPRELGEVAEGVLAELRAGWRFLRGETALLANTLQAVAAQFTTGVLLALTLIYVETVLQRGDAATPTVYSLMYAGAGIGNLIGGFAIGLLGGRIAKGRLVIAGYALNGLCVVGLGLTGNVPAALGLAFGLGVTNMVYVIPSQTMFQQRTPRDMIGRVVGMRFSLVFGSLTVAMGISGFLAAAVGVSAVLVGFGTLTCVAGLAGLFVPALRDA